MGGAAAPTATGAMVPYGPRHRVFPPVLLPLPVPRDALERKGPRRRPQQRLGRRLKEVAKAVGGGYCQLQMPFRLALAVRETVAGHRLGALEGGGGVRVSMEAHTPPHPQPGDGLVILRGWGWGAILAFLGLWLIGSPTRSENFSTGGKMKFIKGA